MTFKELRSEKKDIQEKLNGANRIVSLQINEITRLNRDNLKVKKSNERLLKNLEDEKKLNSILNKRLNICNKLKNKYYDNWINEFSNRDCNAFKIICSVIIVTMAILLIKG